MQLSLTLTRLFIFPDASLAGRIRGGVLSSEARMVDKGQRTRVTESQATKWTLSQRPLFLSLCSQTTYKRISCGNTLKCGFLSSTQTSGTRIQGVAHKFAYLTSTAGDSCSDCSLSTTAIDSVDPGRWWADLGFSERLLILTEEGSCLITQPFMKHLHTVLTMCHALF